MPTKVSVRPGRARVVESRTTGGGDMKRRRLGALRVGLMLSSEGGRLRFYQRSLARSARACVRLTATSLPAWSRMTSL